jgi:hypothetical protein
VKDHELASALRRAAARDPDGDRPVRWERLASGKADDVERTALTDLARADGDADALAALAPLDDAFFARVEARLDAQAAGRTDARVAPATGVLVRRRWARRFAAIPPLALAAGVTLFAMRALRAGPELPAYALLVEGGEKTTRGAASPATERADRPSFARDSEVHVALRPARDVTGPLTVAAAIVDSGRAHAWVPAVRVSPSGVVEIDGEASALLGSAPGDREIVLVVASRPSLPTDADAIAAMTEAPDVRVLRAHVTIVDR